MKFLSALLLAVAISLLAVQSRATTLPDSCGSDNVKFKVKTGKDQPSPAAPGAAMAQIVFIENFGQNQGFCIQCKVTTRVGVDGAWVGANYGNSHFVFAVQPGEHHLCVDWQSNLDGLKQKVGLAHLVAEPGKVYYYKIKVRIRQYENAVDKSLDLGLLDPDEGKYLARITPLATATAKK